MWDLLSTEEILVFVVVVDHLFLLAYLHCLFLLAHDEEERSSVFVAVWVFLEAFRREAFSDFIAGIDVLEELLLHGLWDGGQFSVSLLVFDKVDLVILSEISELVHDA